MNENRLPDGPRFANLERDAWGEHLRVLRENARLRATCDALADDNLRLRTALAIYADKRNWSDDGNYSDQRYWSPPAELHDPAHWDGYTLAQRTLDPTSSHAAPPTP